MFKRITQITGGLALAVGVLATCATAPALAQATAEPAAAKPILFHFNVDDTYTSQVCGIPVEVHLEGVENGFIYPSDWDAKLTRSFKATVTNPATGKSVIASVAGAMIEDVSYDAEAGTVTLGQSIAGLPQKLQAPNGAVLLRDAGLLSIAWTIDAQTGELLSVQTEVRGPHPEFDSDFTRSCEVITAALSA